MANYNGWKNYETWNVSLWINNDYGLYTLARNFMQDYSGHKPYKDFLTYAELVEHNECYDRIDRTPDGVPWESDKLGYKELNEMMWELGR